MENKLNNKKAIVSLTSWKKRIGSVHKTIYNLLSVCSDFHIVLVLSEAEFPNKEKDLPTNLQLLINNELIELLWTPNNYLSYKKIIFTALKYPDFPIISADDDCIYKYDYATELYNAWNSSEEKSLTFVSFYAGKLFENFINLGGYGTLHPPGIYTKDDLDFITSGFAYNLFGVNEDVFYAFLRKQNPKIKIINLKKSINSVAKIHDEIEPLHDEYRKTYKKDPFYKEKFISYFNNFEYYKLCVKKIPELKEIWLKHMKYPLNLESPTTFSEKIQWLKIFDSNDLKTKCSDKIAVREYCKQKLGKDYFIPILEVYNNFDEIDFKKLPKDYVIKTNHGSHTNIIVRNGNINKELAKQKFDKWMSKDWSWYGCEMAYHRIPRKIFIEKYMKQTSKDDLIDYKFLCFNGSPKYCQIISDRHNKNKYANYYDMDFIPQTDISGLDFKANYNIKDTKPKNWDLMKEISKILSKDFNLVRVDFYEIDGILYLSELTFFPRAGYITWTDNSIDLKLGKMLSLK